MSLTYVHYLKIDELLELQQCKTAPPEHDETLFIIIHQVYELWFKLLLHELDKVKNDLTENDLYGAIATFKRCRTIMKTLVSQLDILETMTPMSFMSFRDRLESASGFQSPQFRALEFLLGYKRPEMMEYHQDNPTAKQMLQSRLDERSLIDHFYDFLEHCGLEIPAELRERDVSAPAEANQQIQDGLLRLHRDRADLVILFELMTDFDEGFQEWRYRHVKMVERTIGNKKGTGGSLGAAFLRKSLHHEIFPDLWAIRHKL